MSLRELIEEYTPKFWNARHCEEIRELLKEFAINSQPEEEARGVQHQKGQKKICGGDGKSCDWSEENDGWIICGSCGNSETTN